MSYHRKIDLPLLVVRWGGWGGGTIEAVATVRPILGNFVVKLSVQRCQRRGF